MLKLTYFLSHGQALRVNNGGELLLLEFFDSVLVVSQVQLGAHQDDGSVGAMMSHLRVPLGSVEDTVRGCRMQMDSMADSVESMWVVKRIDFSLRYSFKFNKM